MDDESWLGESFLKMLGKHPDKNKPKIEITRTGDFLERNFEPLVEMLEDQIRREKAQRFAVDNEAARYILDKLNNAQTLIDLGSGMGFSAVQLREICPDLNKVIMVDGVVTQPSSSAMALPSAEFKHEFITDFLKKPSTTADIILLAAVPDHGIKDDEDKKNVANALKPGGIVLVTNDTGLSLHLKKERYDKYFDLIYSNPIYNQWIWRKKETVQDSPKSV
jgi:SAM-dependent methyltransferase